jgi:Mg2+ and Co2+ transporter CorA
MPLTLLTSIWGMSVSFPRFPGGDAAQFWWLFGLMIAIVLFMLALFRRKNWI